MCFEPYYRQPNKLLRVLKQEMNRSWAKEQNVISCYKLDDLRLHWRQFESSWWWKSPLRPSRNFGKVARMKYIIILSGHNKFQEIRPENMALELIWSCRHDECSSEFDGVPCRHQSAWRQDGDRHTGDTKLSWRVEIIALFLHSYTVVSPFWHFFHLQTLFCFWCRWRGCVP